MKRKWLIKLKKFYCRLLAAKRVLFMGENRHWVLISLNEKDLTHIIRCDYDSEAPSKKVVLNTVLHGLQNYNVHQICKTVYGSWTEDERNQERLLFEAKAISQYSKKSK